MVHGEAGRSAELIQQYSSAAATLVDLDDDTPLVRHLLGSGAETPGGVLPCTHRALIPIPQNCLTKEQIEQAATATT
jgi:hypothetical protein